MDIYAYFFLNRYIDILNSRYKCPAVITDVFHMQSPSPVASVSFLNEHKHTQTHTLTHTDTHRHARPSADAHTHMEDTSFIQQNYNFKRYMILKEKLFFFSLYYFLFIRFIRLRNIFHIFPFMYDYLLGVPF